MKLSFKRIFSPKNLLIGLILLFILQSGGIETVFAQGAADANDNTVLKGFASLLGVFINLFTALALLLLNYGGDLMGTELITSQVPMNAIRPMWVIVRNITNIGFVFVLLFLAFSNLFSSSVGAGGNWTIKEKLPKVIFALVAVNFSLMGFKVIIDIVHVGTMAILSIPQTALEATGTSDLEALMEKGVDKDGKSCEGAAATGDCQYFYAAMNSLLCKSGDTKNNDCFFKIDPDSLTRVGGAKSMAAHNLFLAFGVNFQELQKLPALAANIDSWSNVVVNTLFSGIMALAYVTAMIAIFIALLMRVIVLWLGMVFSPLLIAASILGVAGDGDKVKTQVITHLIMPLKIAAAFGVSFIMIAAMFEFDPGFGNGFLQFGPALSQFGQNGYAIMWQIATVVIFWKTAFWALEGSAAEGIVKQVESAGEGIGKYVARAATIDRQLFTVGKGSQTAPVSLGTLLKTPQAIQTAHENDMREKQTKAFQALGILDETAGEATRALGDLTTKVKDLKAVDIMKEIDTAFHTRGTDFFSKATKTDKAGLTSVLGGEKFKGYETEVEAFKREFEAGESKKAGVALAELVKKVVPERNKRKPEYYEVKGTTETGTEATGAEGQAFKITFVSGREKTYEKELLTPASPEALIKTLGAMGITPTALKPLSEEEIKSGVDELITANIFNGGEREEYIKALNTIKAKAK